MILNAQSASVGRDRLMGHAVGAPAPFSGAATAAGQVGVLPLPQAWPAWAVCVITANLFNPLN